MRRVILLILLASLVLAIGATVWLALALRPARIREHLITAVSDRFAARIEVDSAEVAVLPRPAISGTRLRIHLRNAGDAPPLFSVSTFAASAPFRGLVGPRVHLGSVTLGGSDIRIPPGGFKPAVASLDVNDPSPRGSESRSSIVIDEIVSRDARLEIATRKPNKLPELLQQSAFGHPAGKRQLRQSNFGRQIVMQVCKRTPDVPGKYGPYVRRDQFDVAGAIHRQPFRAARPRQLIRFRHLRLSD